MQGGGVTMIQEQIVNWLNSMRLGDTGFISNVDTIIALQALVTFSYNSRIKDITDLDVELNFPASNLTENLHFKGDSHLERPQM